MYVVAMRCGVRCCHEMLGTLLPWGVVYVVAMHEMVIMYTVAMRCCVQCCHEMLCTLLPSDVIFLHIAAQ